MISNKVLRIQMLLYELYYLYTFIYIYIYFNGKTLPVQESWSHLGDCETSECWSRRA
jgi:hypothetical protein